METGWLTLWTMMAVHTFVRRMVDLPRVDPSSASSVHARVVVKLNQVLSARSVSPFLQMLLWTTAIASATLAWRQPVVYDGTRVDFVLITAVFLAATEVLIARVVGGVSADATPRAEGAAPLELRAPRALPVAGAVAGYVLVLLGMALAVMLIFRNGSLQNVDAEAFAMSSLFLLWTSMSLLLWTPRAELGADGLYIRGLQNRFVAFTGRETLVERFWGLELRRDGQLLTRLWYLTARDLRQRKQVAAHIRTLLASGPAPDQGVTPAAALALAREAEADYRTGPPSREELWRIVESPRIAPRVRIDAAHRLAKEAQQDDDARFRRIAAASADPEMRAVLSASR